MKLKIKNALKTKYSNLGFGDKAFTGVAEFLATTVTEEDQIETSIAGVESLLKAFQGDIDKRVSDAVAKAKNEKQKGGDDYDDETQPPIAPKPGENKELDEVKKLITGLAATVNSIVERDKTQTLRQKFEAKAKEKGIENPKLIDKWMPKDEEGLEAAVDDLVAFSEEFEITKANGESTGRPAVSGGTGATLTKKGEAALDNWLESTKPLGSKED